MAVKHIKYKNCCPFWSAISMKCTVCTDGLFIPLDDHKEVFCTTPDYPQCLQYSLQEDVRLQKSKQNPEDSNRRKYTRFMTRQAVTLVKLKKSGKIVTHHATATTMDVSKGGMRLFSNKPLTNNTTLHFSFGNILPEIIQSGIGQVQWCRKETELDGYQAGISFKEELLIEAMGVYLSNQSNPL